jgi:hypothetical protein
MKMVFAKKNLYGELITRPIRRTPRRCLCALRVLEGGSGCDAVPTCSGSRPGDAQYAHDAELVRRDLQSLRELPEADGEES